MSLTMQEGMVADLEGAIKMARRALQLSVHNVSALTGLSDVLRLRFERNKNRADLEEAIMLMRQAINLAPPDEPKQALFLANLGFDLSSRYKLLDEIADLEEAIKVTRQAVNSTPNGDDTWATWVSRLSHQLTRRYARTREVAGLEEAVITARRSVNSVSRNFRHRAAMLDSLGGALNNRHIRTGDLTDINEAIMVTRQAVDTMPAPLDHADRWMYLRNFGQRLHSRYRRVGEMTDLEEAITVTRQAVSLRPLNHDNRSNPMLDLGGLLACRYDRIGFLVDLNEAIVVMRKSIDSMPLMTSAESGAFMRLGAALCCRFGRTAVMADIEDAINALRQEIGLLQSQGVLSSSLTVLGNALWRRYKKKGDAANLEEAITVTRQAVYSTPYDDYERIMYLHSLGIMLRDKHEQTAKITYLEEAIIVTKQVVNAARQDDPGRAAYLFNLGALFKSQYLVTRDEAYLNKALSCFQRAWDCQTAAPLNPVKAASQCLLPLSLQGKLDIARQLGKDIINLLPTVNTKMLDRADQLAVLTGFAGVAADTCALLLAVNQSAEAIYYLENGRANIIGQLVDARSDLSTMTHQYPDLACRYERLRNEVNTPLTGLEQNSTLVWQQRCKTVANLDACITKIRNTPGQERFQLGQTTAEIQECATGGAIVIVNIAGFRSDAIVVSTGRIQTLNLSKMCPVDAKEWQDRKWTGRRWERARKNKEYLEYLAWLWEACVKQIIDEVDNGHGTTGDLPRIWWIGTGLASSMPFHAAGIHSSGSTENAISRVISSYTPSIKALGYSQHRARAADRKGGTLLIATMPTTPGNGQGLGQNSHKPPGLRFVKEEKKQVEGAAGSHLEIEPLEFPSRTDLTKKRGRPGQTRQVDSADGFRAKAGEGTGGIPISVLDSGKQVGGAIRRGSPCKHGLAALVGTICSLWGVVNKRDRKKEAQSGSWECYGQNRYITGSCSTITAGGSRVPPAVVELIYAALVIESDFSKQILHSEDPVLKEMLNGPSTACSVIPSLSKPSSTQAPKVRPRSIRIAVGVSFVWTQSASPRPNRHLRHTHDLDRLSDREENIPGSPRDLYRLGYIAEAGLLSRSPIAIDLINKK
ncbi:hypothetical protein O988_09307 [Pseudogymnoascus sp. VKM F-3808]|nr:hypothetical protein O988_09307 [Pseudogymnoascus sp. VKM F-3808]